MMVRPAFAFPAVLALSACSLAPSTQLPAAPVPQSWPVGDAYLAQSEAGLPEVTYSEIFTDPRLQQVIGLALANNRDVRVAAANLAAARAQVRVTRSAQFPTVDVSGSATEARNSSGSSTISRGGTNEYYALQGAVASYELDLFGKLANATRSQRDNALATEAAARAVRLGLIADIADAWAGYAADKDLLAIAEATARNAEDSVQLTTLRLQGGIAPRTDLAQAQQVLAAAQLAIGEQTTALAQDRNLLRLLVGAEVEPELLPNSLGEIAPSFAALPAGLNSSVLLRRPDVIEAEFRLRAANADIGVARAELFPSLSLTGILGLASTALADLFTGGAFHFSAGANAGYTIFGGGKRANVEVSEAQRDAALASYEKAIQSAFRETADALADQGTLGQRKEAAQANVEAAETNATLTDARYRGGIDSFLDSLIAQRALFAARQQLTAIELANLNNRVTLYRVLGGDKAASGQ